MRAAVPVISRVATSLVGTSVLSPAQSATSGPWVNSQPPYVIEVSGRAVSSGTNRRV